MIATATDMLGLGMYSPYEAARYLRSTRSRFNTWIYGTSRSKPVFEPQVRTFCHHKVVTFLDFAQALSIQDIRLNIGIPLQKIREAYQEAQQTYKIKFPFAVEHGIFVFGNLASLHACVLGIYVPPRGKRKKAKSNETKKEFVDRMADRMVVQLTGKKKGNLMIHQVVQQFSVKLRYSASGIADQYECFAAHGHKIVMDPDVSFGQPYIEDIGYRAETLSDAARIEGSPERAAELYDVPVTAVNAAVEYMRELDTQPKMIRPKKVLRDEHTT